MCGYVDCCLKLLRCRSARGHWPIRRKRPEGFTQLQRALQIDLPSSQLGELSISVNEQCRYTTTLAVTVHIHGLAVPDDSARRRRKDASAALSRCSFGRGDCL